MESKQVIKEYFDNQRYLKLVAYSGNLMKLFAAVWVLLVPSLMIEKGYTPSITIVLGVIFLGFTAYYTWYTVDQSSSWIDHGLGLVMYGLLIFQFFIEIDTIFSIFMFSYGIIIYNLTFPVLSDIARTQRLVTHGKGTPEIVNTLRHANQYLKEQLSWNIRTLGIIGGVGLIALIGIKLIQILTLLVSVRTLQLISNISFILLLLVAVYFGFPSFSEKQDNSPQN